MKSLQLAVPLAVAVCLFVSSAHAVIIDSFDTAQTLQANSGTTSDSGSVGPTAGIVGGHRDTVASWTSGPNNVDLAIDSGSSSALDLNLGSDTLGDATIQWDGSDGSVALDPTGLGGVDLTAGSTLNALGIEVLFDDSPVNVTLRVFTDAGNWSSAVLGLPGGIFAAQSHTLTFASFTTQSGSGADFANVGAIEMFIDPQFAATDLTLDFIESTFVPEPSSMLLAAIGFVGLIAAVRRRRRNR